jgi:hypothetical protein
MTNTLAYYEQTGLGSFNLLARVIPTGKKLDPIKPFRCNLHQQACNLGHNYKDLCQNLCKLHRKSFI